MQVAGALWQALAMLVACGTNTPRPSLPPGLYNYAKALEELEAGLLGGFFYKHFRWACLGAALCSASSAVDEPPTPRKASMALCLGAARWRSMPGSS